MKNQYIGDIGDYGKYGMLRYLEKSGIKIGVNWYLTENDDSNDGKFTTYLDNDKERYLDPELFDLLKKVVVCEDKSISMIEQAEIFSSVCFYHKLISRENRDEWHDNALEALRDAELVFCDPDNGPIGTKSKGSKNSEKYICPLEIVDYYNRGQNVAYSYIFVMHPEDGRRYIAILQKFLYTNWSRVFTEESPGKNSPSSKSVGGKLELEMDSGVIATITAQVDGWVTIQFSDQPGRSTRTRIDHFLSNYRR